MIPACNDEGYLPPGIHPATLEEIAARFGQESELRRVQTESLRWLVELARRGRCKDCRPMSIENRRQLDNARTKLAELEQLYEKKRQEPADDEHVRELTLRSLKKRINQFKEEISRFEARVSSTT